ncbi:MAG: glycosyltransferase [Clostridiales bacterium]|nr:glycosyltransferase [Clostridiales bacterium]
MKISVCIPMYNEGKIIAKTARTLNDYMAANFEDYEVIFADDGSTDGCADIVRDLGFDHIRVVGYPQNQGKGCAVRTAMLAAVGDVMLFTDADLAYGTEVIKRLYQIFAEMPEVDLVIGSRNAGADGYEGYTFVRKLASKAYIQFLKLVGGLKNSDSQCGFKGFRVDAVRRIFPLCQENGFAFDFEILLIAQKLGLKIEEMPVKVINHGSSKVRVLRDTVRMLKALKGMKSRIKRMQITKD